jgi:Fe-S cluster biogenesis protein NfuA
MVQRLLSNLQKLRGSSEEPPSERGPLFAAVRDALGEVQAYAQSHGGRIELLSVSQEGEVVVRFQGACRGCPVADLTFRHGIEQQLKILVPGVVRVLRV